MSWNVGDALGYGWTRFKASPTSFVLGVLVLVAGLAVAVGLAVLLQASLVDVTSGLGVSLLVGSLGVALVVVTAQLFGAGFLRGALGVTEGRAFEPRSVLSIEQAGAVVATSLVIAAGTFLGSLLCYLPGLAVAFVTQWSLYFVVDRGLGPERGDPRERRPGQDPAHRVTRLVRGRGPGRRCRCRTVRSRRARGAARRHARRRLELPGAHRSGDR